MKNQKKKKQKAHMKIHNALRKTEKSGFKEGKSETNYTSSQVLDEIEGEVELRQREAESKSVREREQQCVNFRDLRSLICDCFVCNIFRLDLYFIWLNFGLSRDLMMLFFR